MKIQAPGNQGCSVLVNGWVKLLPCRGLDQGNKQYSLFPADRRRNPLSPSRPSLASDIFAFRRGSFAYKVRMGRAHVLLRSVDVSNAESLALLRSTERFAACRRRPGRTWASST